MDKDARLGDTLSRLASDIYNAMEGDVWVKRLAVSHSCGSMDAKHMIYMMQTHGYPIWAYVDNMVDREDAKDLKVPWEMLEHELRCLGKSKTSIQSLFAELKLGTQKEAAHV